MTPTDLNDLAAAIYEALLPIVGDRRKRKTITYGKLVEALPTRWAGLHPHDPSRAGGTHLLLRAMTP